MAAGIGNLVAESNKAHIKNIFWQLSSLKYISAGILVITLSFLINPFITWWLGIEYKLSAVIVTLFMINLFFMQTRSIVDMFNHSYGLYGDVWAAWAEGIINIMVTIAIAFKWGIIGILMGKTISIFIIVVIWKPYYLYSKGFKESVWDYWKGVLKYYLCFAFAFAYLIITIHLFNNAPEPTLKSMFIFGITEVIPSICIYLLSLRIIGRGTKDLIKRIRLNK